MLKFLIGLLNGMNRRKIKNNARNLRNLERNVNRYD